MRRDSNSREPCDPTRFPGVRLKPLGHPSNTGVHRANAPPISRSGFPESQKAEGIPSVRRSPTITTLQSNRNPRGKARCCEHRKINRFANTALLRTLRSGGGDARRGRSPRTQWSTGRSCQVRARQYLARIRHATTHRRRPHSLSCCETRFH